MGKYEFELVDNLNDDPKKDLNNYLNITMESIESDGYVVSKGERSKRNGIMNKIKKHLLWGIINEVWFKDSKYILNNTVWDKGRYNRDLEKCKIIDDTKKYGGSKKLSIYNGYREFCVDSEDNCLFMETELYDTTYNKLKSLGFFLLNQMCFEIRNNTNTVWVDKHYNLYKTVENIDERLNETYGLTKTKWSEYFNHKPLDSDLLNWKLVKGVNGNWKEMYDGTVVGSYFNYKGKYYRIDNPNMESNWNSITSNKIHRWLDLSDSFSNWFNNNMNMLFGYHKTHSNIRYMRDNYGLDGVIEYLLWNKYVPYYKMEWEGNGEWSESVNYRLDGSLLFDKLERKTNEVHYYRNWIGKHINGYEWKQYEWMYYNGKLNGRIDKLLNRYGKLLNLDHKGVNHIEDIRKY